MTYPGYEHVKWQAAVEKIEPERLFSFTWAHPKSFDKATYSGGYSSDPKTLAEFLLEKTKNGTRLRITESGFDKLPADLRLEAFRRKEGGWTEQVKNLENYVAKQA